MDQEAQADNEAETMDCPMEYAGERLPMFKFSIAYKFRVAIIAIVLNVITECFLIRDSRVLNASRHDNGSYASSNRGNQIIRGLGVAHTKSRLQIK